MPSPETSAAPPAESVSPSPAARIVSHDQHPIRLSMLDRDALQILRKLQEAGFAGYLVGGGVRDLYLGKTPKDFDISTDARPGQLRRLFPHSNTIGRRFRLVQVYFRGGKTIEISTLRSLSEHDLDGPENVLAPNNTFGTLSEDARRRDLTINSLFFEIAGQTIIDYVNGIDDLDRAIIRIVGDPDRRIARDPVRMLRAIRHAARNGFTIEAKSWAAIAGNCDKLSLCPPSRLRDEILKDLTGGATAAWFELAVDSGIFTTLFPLYREPLTGPDRTTIREQLRRICHAIDRLHQPGENQPRPRQPDHLLFALLLLPWADWRIQLFRQRRANPELFQLAKELRDEIDQGIGVELNLSRSLRQEMVAVLTNLAQLLHNRQPQGWPKWLRKKSYFRRSQLLYHLYLEATTGVAIPEELLQAGHLPAPPPSPAVARAQNKPAAPPRPEHRPPPPSERTAGETNGSDSRPSRPAFAPTTRGGIFGFKK
jgi:poly(A) polymerase